MSQLLGLLDSLEATVLDGKKLPVVNKVVIDEQVMLDLIDKIRLTIKNNGENVRQSVMQVTESDHTSSEPTPTSSEATEKAASEADEIRAGANEYADYVLANLQMIVTKMQKDIIKFEKNIENGREVLDSNRGPQNGEENHDEN